MIQEGFFSKSEVTSVSNPIGRSLSCASCQLYVNCNTPRFKPQGNGKKQILNVFESPSYEDDKSGKMFQSKSGKLIQKTYKALGIDLMEDCININALSCYSDNKFTAHNVDCCRKFVLKAVQDFQPKVIVLFGDLGLQSLIGHRWKKDLGGINKWRGWTIPDQDFGCWVCPVFSPSYVERSFGEFDKITAENTVWVNDLKQVVQLTDHTFPIYKEPTIEVVENLEVLRTIEHGFAWDIETNSIKGHSKESKIISVAICDSEEKAYVFLLPQKRSQRLPLVELLENPNIGKYAHNLKFEHSWIESKLGVIVQGWKLDTMLMCHCEDNRQGITSLKFQTLVNFGILDYSSEIEPYLKAKEEKNANSINRIEELISTVSGKQQLLKYNALDAYYTYMLVKKQMAWKKVFCP